MSGVKKAPFFFLLTFMSGVLADIVKEGLKHSASWFSAKCPGVCLFFVVFF